MSLIRPQYTIYTTWMIHCVSCTSYFYWSQTPHSVQSFFFSYVVWPVYVLRAFFPPRPAYVLLIFLVRARLSAQHFLVFYTISYEIYRISYVRPRQMLTQTRTTSLFVLNFTFRNVSHHEIVRLFFTFRLFHPFVPLSLFFYYFFNLSLPKCCIQKRKEFSSYEMSFPVVFHVHIIWYIHHFGSVLCVDA